MKSVNRRTSLLTIGALLGSASGLLLVGCDGTDAPPGDVEQGRKAKQDALKGVTTTPKKARKGGSDDDSF